MSSLEENLEVFAPAVIFTESAAVKVKELLDEEGDPKLNLRISVQGGGCSGFKYHFSFDDVIDSGDEVVEKQVGDNTVKLLIDPISYQYLVGAKIDYKESLEGAQFVISNPNAQTTCGCGSSFSAG
jgi:iron-sulfur cluster insertion protein